MSLIFNMILIHLAFVSFPSVTLTFSSLAVDLCANGKHKCNENATCTFSGPSMYNCSCLEGFRGDGFVCDPIDPCRDFYGGCNFTTSICTYKSPGKVSQISSNHLSYSANSNLHLKNKISFT